MIEYKQQIFDKLEPKFVKTTRDFVFEKMTAVDILKADFKSLADQIDKRDFKTVEAFNLFYKKLNEFKELLKKDIWRLKNSLQLVCVNIDDKYTNHLQSIKLRLKSLSKNKDFESNINYQSLLKEIEIMEFFGEQFDIKIKENLNKKERASSIDGYWANFCKQIDKNKATKEEILNFFNNSN